MRQLDSIADSVIINLSISGRQWKTEEAGVLPSTGSQRVRQDLVTEQQPEDNLETSERAKDCDLRS